MEAGAALPHETLRYCSQAGRCISTPPPKLLAWRSILRPLKASYTSQATGVEEHLKASYTSSYWRG
jgi:hypothetical protein